MELSFKKLTETAKEPVYSTPGSAGADMFASEDVTITPQETKRIPTGIAMEIPKGHVGLMFPRSGLSLRTSLRQPHSVGVIDSDYRGEVSGMFTNTGSEKVTIEQGCKFAQMVIVPIVKVKWTQVDELSETERGAGGFGSTGI